MNKNKIQKALLYSYNRYNLLSNATRSEKIAFYMLEKLHFEYIKQYPIYTGKKTYYADIYLPKHKTVLEIDGGYHTTERQKRFDKNRSASIRRLGYHVVRLSNHDVRNYEKFINKLKTVIKKN